jgi:alpha-D-xyloside xylohydrolase
MFNIAPDSHPAYRAMLAYDRLRYRLMPYIYSLTGMVTHNDYTIMRALVMDFGDDRNVFSIGDQFMFGPALLINPVTEYKARSRSVYLPDGCGWYDLRTGTFYAGGQTIPAEAPYSDIPVFVKTGSIIPFGPAIQYTTEKAADPIRLFIYTGANGSFTLYEDENVNNNYEKGALSLIPLTYDEHAGTLTIGARQGRFAGMLDKRTFEVVWIDANTTKPFSFEQAPNLSVSYDGDELILKK